MKKFRYIAIFCVLIITGIIFFDHRINLAIERELNKRDLSQIKHDYANIIRDRGGIIKDYACKKGDLLLFGSSELKSPAEQNPIRVFPNKGAEYDVSIYGREYTQCLQHAASINSINTLQPNSKVAILLTLQWFFYKDGVEKKDYECNFSKYQFLNVMNDKNITKKDKLYYAKRTADLLNETTDYEDMAIYAKLYSNDAVYSNVLLAMLKPYYAVQQNFLELKDKVQSYKKIKKMDIKREVKINDVNWNKEKEKAEMQSKENTDNNVLKVNNDYYNKILKDKIDSMKDESSVIDMIGTKEYEDYRFLLNVCKNKGIKPLIILMPAHGAYYDYVGIGKEKRDYYYNEVTKMANEYGFDILSLQDKDYEDYYLWDVMHLGPKGWIDVDKKITDYYNKNVTNQS